MMRRLLLIEAAAFPKPNTRPILWPKRKRTRRLMEFYADKPEDWRVSFRCFAMPKRLSSPARGGSGREAVDGGANARTSNAFALHRPLSHATHDSSPARGGAKQFHSAWPAAERYEALLRVFNDPTAYARRLAKRLHATPHRLRELLRVPPGATERVERFDHLTEAVHARWRPPPLLPTGRSAAGESGMNGIAKRSRGGEGAGG